MLVHVLYCNERVLLSGISCQAGYLVTRKLKGLKSLSRFHFLRTNCFTGLQHQLCRIRTNWIYFMMIASLYAISYTSISSSFHQFITNPNPEEVEFFNRTVSLTLSHDCSAENSYTLQWCRKMFVCCCCCCFFWGGGEGSNYLRTQNSIFSTKLNFGRAKNKGASTRNKGGGLQPPKGHHPYTPLH